MSFMNAVDTNVLVYACDPRDASKQDVATALIETLDDPVLIWQVACEYLAATRKLDPIGYSREEAWEDIRELRAAWPTLFPTWAVLERAGELLGRYSLSFWDATVLAACVDGGIERLYTEDFDAYRTVDGVEIVNPFKELPSR
jgi:predicted nucleic acid-binding protein